MTRPVELPRPIEDLVDALFESAGTVAVVLGGSRAAGGADATSDWDIGVLYRGAFDVSALARYGEVHSPGSWGRLMNGGAWLDVDGARVDVLLRDLDAIEHWHGEAQRGYFEIDGLPGYLAGIPTYSLVAEAAVARPLRGSMRLDVTFPRALADRAPAIWRFNRDFSLYHASMHAARGAVVPAVGQAARAIIEEAHARCCEARRWVLNEKRMLAGCDLDGASALLAAPGQSPAELLGTLAALREAVDASPPYPTASPTASA